MSSQPGEGVVSGAHFTLSIALSVQDPDAAERAIDDGLALVRRARRPLFPEAFLASAKVGAALRRGDPRGAIDVARALGTQLSTGIGTAYARHLLGDHRGAEADALAQLGIRDFGFLDHSRRLLLALTAAAEARWDDAARELAEAAAQVRRYRFPLTLEDCVVVCGALAAMEGRLERACVLLAAVADRASGRPADGWAGYLHH